jgi:acyl-CoA thioesterase-1
MSVASTRTYLRDLVKQLNLSWPNNPIVNIVCHGHSVPAGYTATPMVDTLNAYPHLIHKNLKERFPFAVINVIVTAIGGENSFDGAQRFGRDVLCHGPSLITIDYGLNDRSISLPKADESWRLMIERALERNVKLLLLTPTPDVSGIQDASAPEWTLLSKHAELIRALSYEYQVGLVDSFAAFEKYVHTTGPLTDLLSWPNHPNRKGHAIVAVEVLRWFVLGYDLIP